MAAFAPQTQTGTQKPGTILQTWEMSLQQKHIPPSWKLIPSDLPRQPWKKSALGKHWNPFFEMAGVHSASLLLFHPPSGIRSSFQLALMPFVPLSPRAVFEVGGRCVVTGVSGELEGTSGAIWNLCCSMGWDYRFLFLCLKKKKCMFTFILKYAPSLGYSKTEKIALVLKNTPRVSLFMQSWLWQVAATKAMSSRTWKLDIYPFNLGLGDLWGEGGRGGIRKFINGSWCFLFPRISFPSYLKKITSLNLNFPYL